MSEGKEMKPESNQSEQEGLENQESNTGTSTDTENESSQIKSDASHKESNQDGQEGNIDVGALEATNKSLSGQISALQKQLNEQQKATAAIENREKVKDKLLNSDLPDSVKNTLKEELEELTPETFDKRAERYTTLYNQALENKKVDQAQINRPDKSEDNDFITNLSAAKTEQDVLNEFIKLKG